MTDSPQCSLLAQQSNAPLYGTAAQVDYWLLVEYPNNWRAKALSDNVLPAQVNRHLAKLPGEVAQQCGKKLRVLFIKQSNRTQIAQPLVMLARANDQSLLSCELPDYLSISDLRAEHIAQNQLPGATTINNSIYLVCTNGQRDRCCGRYGIPLYKQLHARFKDRIWQTSHIGGHRFAPNLLCLPDGVSYGFVKPDEAIQLVTQHDEGLISLGHLRGRSHYTPQAQAAEYFLRIQLKLPEQHALTLVSVQQNDLQTKVIFEEADNRYSVSVGTRVNAQTIIASCGASAKSTDKFYLDKIETT